MTNEIMQTDEEEVILPDFFIKLLSEAGMIFEEGQQEFYLQWFKINQKGLINLKQFELLYPQIPNFNELKIDKLSPASF